MLSLQLKIEVGVLYICTQYLTKIQDDYNNRWDCEPWEMLGKI